MWTPGRVWVGNLNFTGIHTVRKRFIGLWRRATVSSLEEKKIRVVGTKKWGKPLAGHEMCEELIKEEIWGDCMIVEKGVLLEESSYVDEEGEVFSKDYIEVINLILEVIHLPYHQYMGHYG